MARRDEGPRAQAAPSLTFDGRRSWSSWASSRFGSLFDPLAAAPGCEWFEDWRVGRLVFVCCQRECECESVTLSRRNLERREAKSRAKNALHGNYLAGASSCQARITKRRRASSSGSARGERREARWPAERQPRGRNKAIEQQSRAKERKGKQSKAKRARRVAKMPLPLAESTRAQAKWPAQGGRRKWRRRGSCISAR